jgi:hypothetical protein
MEHMNSCSQAESTVGRLGPFSRLPPGRPQLSEPPPAKKREKGLGIIPCNAFIKDISESPSQYKNHCIAKLSR